MKKLHLKSIILGVALASTCGLSSCSTWDGLNRTQQGALIGAGGGAVLGSAVGGSRGALIGGIGGGVAGGAIGHNTH